jgi:DNA (cytosine-5)-methyltransferase 1
MTKVLDTFAGAGGFSLGFSMAGCEVIGAIEVDKWACDTFSYNHPNALVLNEKIESLSGEMLSMNFSSLEPDIILGGPPCQGFSIANKNAGDPMDPRNSLFMEFIRVGKVLGPKYLILENVPNIIKARTHSGEKVVDIIEREFKKLGYFVYHRVLEATNYGVPQIRKRFFLIASYKELENPFPEPTHSSAAENSFEKLFETDLGVCPKLWDAISDLPKVEAGEGAETMDYEVDPENEYQFNLRNGSKVVFNHTAMRHSKRMVERFASMSWGQSTSDVAAHHKPLKRNGNGIFSDKVYDQNNRRMFPDRPCHTIPASFYANFVHPYMDRNFTPREGARIQSFPDWYFFKGKPTIISHKLLAREGRDEEKHLCQYNQIGNAVPPLLARAIAKNLLIQ